MRLLVLQSAGEVADLSQRCVRWANAVGVDVEIAPPAATQTLARHVRRASRSGIDGVVLERGASADTAELAGAVEAAEIPVVAVSPAYVADRSGPLDQACVRVIHGRGRTGFRWALAHLRARASGPYRVWAYGDGPDQVGDLRVPADVPQRGAPLAVLFHGGFWRDEWERDLMDAAAVDLTGRGWITWNVEYRRMGPSGGGWPATLDDAQAVLDAIGDLPAPIDVTQVVVLGHSAGAQLALCSAARSRRPVGPVRPATVVGLAPLTDLDAAARDNIGWGSVTSLLGDPDRHRRRYRLASPAALLPLGIPQLLIHGSADRHVPPTMTTSYTRAARDAGDAVQFVEVAADHFQVIDPAHPAWATLATALQTST
jgi:acetyl esterase/lipase